MFSLTNKHSELFDYLIENAKRFERASVIAHEAMADISVLPERIDEIVSLQHQTEQAGLQIVIQLAKTFITPIDREDLFFCPITLQLVPIAFTAFSCASRCTMSQKRHRLPFRGQSC